MSVVPKTMVCGIVSTVLRIKRLKTVVLLFEVEDQQSVPPKQFGNFTVHN